MSIDLFGLEGLPLTAARALVLTSGAIMWTLLLVRLVGLRSFAKMTSFDFVATVATASLISQAATRSNWIEYVQCLAALGSVFLLQWLLAWLRLVSPSSRRALQNRPRLLMVNGAFLDEEMQDARVSRDNVLAAIRVSSASSLEEVAAVVLETTGDISVMKGSSPDPHLLIGVSGAPPADERS